MLRQARALGVSAFLLASPALLSACSDDGGGSGGAALRAVGIRAHAATARRFVRHLCHGTSACDCSSIAAARAHLSSVTSSGRGVR